MYCSCVWPPRAAGPSLALWGAAFWMEHLVALCGPGTFGPRSVACGLSGAGAGVPGGGQGSRVEPWESLGHSEGKPGVGGGSGLQVTPACSRGWSVPPQEFCDSSGALPVAGAPSGWAGAPPWGAGHPPALPAATAPCSPTATSGKKQAAKSKEELAQEKKKELERRLQDVSGQLSNSKKPAKRGRAAPVLLGAGERAAAPGTLVSLPAAGAPRLSRQQARGKAPLCRAPGSGVLAQPWSVGGRTP